MVNVVCAVFPVLAGTLTVVSSDVCVFIVTGKVVLEHDYWILSVRAHIESACFIYFVALSRLGPLLTMHLFTYLMCSLFERFL